MADSLAARVKDLARQMGAAKVGVAAVEALSGPPSADASRVLPGARAVVSFLVVEPEGAVIKDPAKEDSSEYRDRSENPEVPNFIRGSMDVPGYEQLGVLARSRHDTVVTCGNCAIVCFETLQQRAKALKLLLHSGVVVEKGDGRVRVVSAEEARRYQAEYV